MARPAITRVEIRNEDGTLTNRIPMGSGLSVTVDVEGLRVPRQFVAVSLTTETDLCLVQVNTNMKPLEVFDRNAAQTSVTLTIPHLPLNPGRYWLELRVSEGGVLGVKSLVDKIERAAPIEVVPADVFGTGFQPQSGRWRALCIVNPSWEIRNGAGVVAATAPVADRSRRPSPAAPPRADERRPLRAGGWDGPTGSGSGSGRAATTPTCSAPGSGPTCRAGTWRRRGCRPSIVPPDGSGAYDVVVFQKAYAKRDLELAAEVAARGTRWCSTCATTTSSTPSPGPSTPTRSAGCGR